jgi:pimeloyl-[acyl-carrier protein] synthase
MSGAGEPLVFDPLSRAFRADPYPTYARLRREDPVHRSPLDGGFWVVTRHADVALCLRDPRCGMGEFWSAQKQRLGDDAAYHASSTWMLFKDPPDHTRLRKLVSQAFTPRATERMRERVSVILEELLTAPLERGRLDVMSDLAFPLPVYVIADMLGVPPGDRDAFHEWTQAMNLIFEPVLGPETIARANRAVAALDEYLRALVRERRKAPREDLLSGMIAAEEAGDRLTEDELVGNAGLLLSAGYETTMGLLGNGILALLRGPDELRRLAENPSLGPNAIEEFLRYDSPVQYTLRFALRDFELAGREIRVGDRLFLIVASANRDPERFPEPDRLDVGRDDVEHLSFGGGRHFCLGAPLARLEGEIVLRRLVPHLLGAELESDVLEHRDSYLNHALEHLPVRLADR